MIHTQLERTISGDATIYTQRVLGAHSVARITTMVIGDHARTRKGYGLYKVHGKVTMSIERVAHSC